MNCQNCGSEMKMIPAGVSKTTGKPYNAFFACPNKCPKSSISSQVARVGVQTDPYQKVMAVKNDYIEKAQERKDESIKMSRSISGAYTIVSALIQSGMLANEMDINHKLQQYTDMLYNLEPTIQ